MKPLNAIQAETLEKPVHTAHYGHSDHHIDIPREYPGNRQWASGEPVPAARPSMFSFFLDIPNCISLAGLCCALMAIFCSVLGYFPLAIVGILWAIFFDWLDGIVARKTRGRTESKKKFGNQIDSIIDMVSFGVFPAVFLMSYARFSPAFVPGAVLIVSIAAVRLSYFTIFGLADPKHYSGLALDNNMIILAFAFLFERFFPQRTFSYVLYGLMTAMLFFNVAPIKTPKFSGKSVYVLFAYTAALTAVYARDFILSL